VVPFPTTPPRQQRQRHGIPLLRADGREPVVCGGVPPDAIPIVRPVPGTDRPAHEATDAGAVRATLVRTDPPLRPTHELTHVLPVVAADTEPDVSVWPAFERAVGAVWTAFERANIWSVVAAHLVPHDATFGATLARAHGTTIKHSVAALVPPDNRATDTLPDGCTDKRTGGSPPDVATHEATVVVPQRAPVGADVPTDASTHASTHVAPVPPTVPPTHGPAQRAADKAPHGAAERRAVHQSHGPTIPRTHRAAQPATVRVPVSAALARTVEATDVRALAATHEPPDA